MNRLLRYARELAFCCRVAGDLGSAGRLMAQALRFHFSNLGGAGVNRDNRSLRHYRVKAGESSQSLWLRTLGGDFFVFFEIFMDEVYRIPDAWRRPGATVLDLGANIGLTTRYLHGLMPDARFVCVEPNPANFEVLERNCAPLAGCCALERAAVAAKSGIGVLEQSELSWATRLSSTGSGPRTRLVSVDELIDRHHLQRIDLAKIDIEGAERDLFAANLDWLARVGAILIELHGDYSESDFAAAVEPQGFRLLPPEAGAGNRMLAAVRDDPPAAAATATASL